MQSGPATRDWFWDGVPLVAQVLFWITLGIVTVLTYRHARRTVLAPLRTEVFKQQLELIRQLLNDFGRASEVDLREAVGFEEFFEVNAARLFDDYARSAFGWEAPSSQSRPYDIEFCPVTRMKAEDLVLADEHVIDPGRLAPMRRLPPRLVEDWANYEYSIVFIPRTMGDFVSKVEQWQSDPLLPWRCGEILGELLDAIDGSIESLNHILTDASRSMPEKYPTLESMRGAVPHWIHHQWVDVLPQLTSHAHLLAEFAREYFASDDLKLTGGVEPRRASARAQSRYMYDGTSPSVSTRSARRRQDRRSRRLHRGDTN